MAMRRPTWDEYFIQLSESVASRSTCDRGKSGCVIVKGRRILCTGYAGSPPGLPHCDEAGHLFKKIIHENGEESNHCMRTIHAEQNALIQAAKFGISVEGATLYCKMVPCRNCAMSIIGAGITRVVCGKRYHADAESREMFKQCGIELIVINDEEEEYANK